MLKALRFLRDLLFPYRGVSVIVCVNTEHASLFIQDRERKIGHKAGLDDEGVRRLRENLQALRAQDPELVERDKRYTELLKSQMGSSLQLNTGEVTR